MRRAMQALHVRHATPGRVRVHLPHWPGDGPHLIEQRLRSLPGVHHARANPLTGSVLVRFDPDRTDQAAVLAVLHSPNERTTTVPAERAAPAYPAGEKSSSAFPLLRAVAASLGLGLVVARRLGLWKGALPGAAVLAFAAGALALVQKLPPVRTWLQQLLGVGAADLVFHLTEIVAHALPGDLLRVALHVGEALLPAVGLAFGPLAA